MYSSEKRPVPMHEFPETLIVLNFNKGGIFITLGTAPMALLMLHHIKTVFIRKLTSRTLVGRVYHAATEM